MLASARLRAAPSAVPEEPSAVVMRRCEAVRSSAAGFACGGGGQGLLRQGRPVHAPILCVQEEPWGYS